MKRKEGILVLDHNNHIKFEGSLNFETNVYEKTLNCDYCDSKITSSLLLDSTNVFSSKSLEEVQDATYSSGQTYFMRSNEKPRCLLEQLALNIFLAHTSSARFDGRKSGAEWWVNVIESEDDVGFHWDRDYGVEENQGLHLYPQLGTVTYLTNIGGPTIVVNKKGTLSSEDGICGESDLCVVSAPLWGKHLVFNGNLLHAAPSEFMKSALETKLRKRNGKRITFLVNIWLNHIPTQSLRLPSNLARRLSPVVKSQLFQLGPVSESLEIVTERQNSVGKEWGFTSNNEPYIITLPIPLNSPHLEGYSRSKTATLKYSDSDHKISIRKGILSTDSDTEEEVDENSDDVKDIFGNHSSAKGAPQAQTTSSDSSKKRRISLNSSNSSKLIENETVARKRRR